MDDKWQLFSRKKPQILRTIFLVTSSFRASAFEWKLIDTTLVTFVTFTWKKNSKKIPFNFTIFWSSCDLFTSNRARYCWAISRGVILPLFQPPISSLAYSTTWQFGFYHRTSPRTAPFCKVRNGIFIILIFIISRIIFFLFEINKYLF